FTVGAIAVGVNDSVAASEGTTKASFAGQISGSAANRNLSIRALGEASNSTRSEAGNGGVIAGAASSTTNRDNSKVTATLGSDTAIRVGNLDLTAQHVSHIQNELNSTQASLVGMSGAWAKSNIDVGVTAVVEDDVDLDANNIEITARDS